MLLASNRGRLFGGRGDGVFVGLTRFRFEVLGPGLVLGPLFGAPLQRGVTCSDPILERY